MGLGPCLALPCYILATYASISIFVSAPASGVAGERHRPTTSCRTNDRAAADEHAAPSPPRSTDGPSPTAAAGGDVVVAAPPRRRPRPRRPRPRRGGGLPAGRRSSGPPTSRGAAPGGGGWTAGRRSRVGSRGGRDGSRRGGGGGDVRANETRRRRRRRSRRGERPRPRSGPRVARQPQPPPEDVVRVFRPHRLVVCDRPFFSRRLTPRSNDARIVRFYFAPPPRPRTREGTRGSARRTSPSSGATRSRVTRGSGRTTSPTPAGSSTTRTTTTTERTSRPTAAGGDSGPRRTSCRVSATSFASKRIFALRFAFSFRSPFRRCDPIPPVVGADPPYRALPSSNPQQRPLLSEKKKGGSRTRPATTTPSTDTSPRSCGGPRRGSGAPTPGTGIATSRSAATRGRVRSCFSASFRFAFVTG